MDVELGPVAAAGLIGGLAMLVVQLALAGSGHRVFDVLAMWATFLGVDGSRIAGLIAHFAVSVAVAVLYAIAFRLAGATDTGWAWGAVGAIVHWIVAGAFLGTVPAGGDDFTAPGPFGMRLGPRNAIGFFVGHLAFGLAVGVVYFALHSTGGLGGAT